MPNKGTGAGGSKTTKNGNSFEQKTNFQNALLEKGFVLKRIDEKKGTNNFYLEKEITPSKTILYLTKRGLKAYFKKFFNIELFREPDEAYVICEDGNYSVKILEKKNQEGAGSVDTKLLAGIGFIEEYQICLGDKFKVQYAFTLSTYLANNYKSDQLKYKVLRQINEKYKINVFFGDDKDYFEKIAEWISL